MKLTLTTKGHHPIVIPKEQMEYTIGRDKETNFPLPMMPGISRKHCTIFIEGDTAFILDNGSKNGTFRNGTQIAPTDKPIVELKHGDEIRLGKKMARFKVHIEN